MSYIGLPPPLEILSLLLVLIIGGLVSLFFKPIRKATGAILIIAGVVFCFAGIETGLGLIIGLPLVFFGVIFGIILADLG